MPSLARKSMKMMRDAYNFAATYDVNQPSSPLPGQYQSGSGLSYHFAQPPPPGPPQGHPQAGYARPSTSHGQQPPPLPYGAPTYLAPTPPPGQPHGSWAIPSQQPPVPPIPQAHLQGGNPPIDPYTGQPYPPPSPNVAPPGHYHQSLPPANHLSHDPYTGQPYPPSSPNMATAGMRPGQYHHHHHPADAHGGPPGLASPPTASPISPPSAGSQPGPGYFPHQQLSPMGPPNGAAMHSMPSPPLAQGAHQFAGVGHPLPLQSHPHEPGMPIQSPTGQLPPPAHFSPRPAEPVSPISSPPPPLPSRTPSRPPEPTRLGLAAAAAASAAAAAAAEPQQAHGPPPAVMVSAPVPTVVYHEMPADPAPAPSISPVPANVFEMDSNEAVQPRPKPTTRQRAHTTHSASPVVANGSEHFELPGTVTSFQALSPHSRAGSATDGKLKPSPSPASWRQSCTLEVVQGPTSQSQSAPGSPAAPPSRSQSQREPPREPYQQSHQQKPQKQPTPSSNAPQSPPASHADGVQTHPSTRRAHRPQNSDTSVSTSGVSSEGSHHHHPSHQTNDLQPGHARPHASSVSVPLHHPTPTAPFNHAQHLARHNSTSTASSVSHAPSSHSDSIVSPISHTAPYDMNQMLGAVNAVQMPAMPQIPYHHPSRTSSLMQQQQAQQQQQQAQDPHQAGWNSPASNVVSQQPPPPQAPPQLSRFEQYNEQYQYHAAPPPTHQPMPQHYQMGPVQYHAPVQQFQGHHGAWPPNPGQPIPYPSAPPIQAYPAQNTQPQSRADAARPTT